jgi:hypothetical protein
VKPWRPIAILASRSAVCQIRPNIGAAVAARPGLNHRPSRFQKTASAPISGMAMIVRRPMRFI